MIERLKAWARKIKAEITLLAYAARDPRTPWFAKVFAALVVGYALSPIDLIPDFIPIIGLLDEAILLPLALIAVRWMVPREVLAEHRARVVAGERLPANRVAAAAIILIWLLVAVFGARWALQFVSAGT